MDAYQGKIILSLTGEQTKQLSLDPSSKSGRFIGVWDMQWTPADKQPRTLCQGTVECVADVFDKVTLTIDPEDIKIEVEEIPVTKLVVDSAPDIIVLASGSVGGPGPEGPQGPTGQQGPIGPQGAQGPSGTAVGSAHYKWKTGITATDPGDGYIKGNNVNATLFTEVYASVHSQEGQLVRFDQAEVDSEFYIYETGNFETWNKYKVTAPIVINSNAWFKVPCVC